MHLLSMQCQERSEQFTAEARHAIDARKHPAAHLTPRPSVSWDTWTFDRSRIIADSMYLRAFGVVLDVLEGV